MAKVGQSELAACHRYFAFGLHIASEFPVPELFPLKSGRSGTPDVTIAMGAVSDCEYSTGFHSPVAGTAILAIDNVGRYCVRNGREIVVAPHPKATERNIRLFLLGSAFGILCHQRGLLPLHANAIVVDRSVIAFAGAAGIGKSTLAAHFQARGYDVLCDDVCVLNSDDEWGRPLAYPGLPRLKLWRDAAEAFGYDSTRLDRAIEGLDKYHVPLARRPAPEPLPLKRLYVLEDASADATRPVSRLTGTAAVQAILNNVYRSEFLKDMGLLAESFRRAVAVAKHVPVYSAPRIRGYDAFAREAARLERHIGLESTVNNERTVAPQPALALEGRKL